jgi:hypothetical protein
MVDMERVGKALNPLVHLILSSQLHSMLGRLVLIRYTEKKSGVKYTLPVRYAKSDNELIVVAEPDHQHKKWWRNLRSKSAIHICYRGCWIEASAMAFDGDVAEIAPRLPAYLKRFPPGAAGDGLILSPGNNVHDTEKLREAAKRIVMVAIKMTLGT